MSGITNTKLTIIIISPALDRGIVQQSAAMILCCGNCSGCSVSNYIIQSGSQLKFGSIADTKAEYDGYSFYNGYVESGAFDSCGTYQVDTTWVLFSTKIGFSADRTYKVTLDDVTSDGFTAKTATILISQ